MTKEEKILNQIIELASMHWWKNIQGLTHESRVVEDIGIDGSDAEDFMYEFSRDFNVDITGFVFEDYFSQVRGGVIGFFVDLLNPKPYHKRKELTLRDLVDAVKAGKWISQ